MPPSKRLSRLRTTTRELSRLPRTHRQRNRRFPFVTSLLMDCGPIDPVTLFTSLKHAEVIKNIEHKLTLKKRQRTLRNEHMSSLVAQFLFKKNSLIVL